MKPAEVLAIAPVVRFAQFESFGSAEDEDWTLDPSTTTMLLSKFERAIFCLSVLRLVKYKAEPKPVRSAEGAVPRQNPRIAFGPAKISRKEALREVEPDCCTRVLSKSAGWRRTADRTPEPNPAVKWKAVSDSVFASCSLYVAYHAKTEIGRHLTYPMMINLPSQVVILFSFPYLSSVCSRSGRQTDTVVQLYPEVPAAISPDFNPKFIRRHVG